MTHETEHTPAPWFATKDKHGIDGGHYVIAVVAPERGDRQLVIHAEDGNDSQGDSNAQLFTAAPKMLKALKSMASELSGDFGKDYAIAEWPEIFEAITEAEGES